MHKYLYTLIFSLYVSLSAAQETVVVTGQVFDAATEENLAFVNVSVMLQSNSELVTGTITDDQGRFELRDLPLGNYNILFSFIGYAETFKEVVAGGLNPIFDLGRVLLQPTAEELEGVEVVGQEAITSRALDKKSFNFDNNIAQAGGSVMDAMKTLPGVAFDQDGKVVLRGSDKVMVLVDGKQSSLTGFGNQKGLANIPASNIEKIEIINNPSAKYDATGFAGIINIIYKEETKEGFNGDVGLSFGLGALGKRRADTPTDLGSFSVNPKLIPSLNLNYRKGKLNYFLQSEFILQEALPNNEFTTRNYDDGRNILSQVPENRRQFRTILTGGADWYIDDRNTLTLSGLYDREKHIDTAQVAFIDLDTDTRNRFYTWEESEVTRFINASANYNHDFEQPGHSLGASLQYTQGLEDETYSLNDSSAVRVGRDKTNIRALEHTTSVSLDYARPLSSGKIEMGSKLRIRRLPVDYIITQGQNSIIYPGLGTFSKWGENLYALYGNYLLERKCFDIEAGLRAEHTDVFYDLDPDNVYYPQNDAYDYFELFPSVRFTFKANERNRLSLFYNRRIDRPGEPELRVFPKYDDPELLKVGNPYLRPQFTNTVELAHKWLWSNGSLFSAIYHRTIKDPYLRIFSIDDSEPNYDIVNRIYQNVGSGSNSGIELLLSQRIGERLDFSASFNAYVNGIDAFTGLLLFPEERPFTIEESNDEAWDAKVSGEYRLPDVLTAQLTAVYQSPKNIPQGEQLGRASVDFGLKKAIWQNKGEITLSATDLFNTFGIRQDIVGNGFTARYQNYYETQVVRLGLKYSF